MHPGYCISRGARVGEALCWQNFSCCHQALALIELFGTILRHVAVKRLFWRPNTVTAYELQQIQLLAHRDRHGLAMQAKYPNLGEWVCCHRIASQTFSTTNFRPDCAKAAAGFQVALRPDGTHAAAVKRWCPHRR